MKKQAFDREYIEYWKKRTASAADGSRVPAEEVIAFFLDKLDIRSEDAVLDLGCGFGRLHPFLSARSDDVTGIDVDAGITGEAASHPYKKLATGSAEKTGFPDDSFDAIIAWEVYDVVEQNRGLIEENRILKMGGSFLVTGKNSSYAADDRKAFVAERNAKLKDFPNHFTDAYGLIENCRRFGFEVLHAYGFPKRGDFGDFIYFDILAEKKKRDFYQFLIILKKIGSPSVSSAPSFRVCSEFSDTALKMAEKAGWPDNDLRGFFEWHKKKYGETEK